MSTLPESILRDELLSECEAVLGYRFKDRELLKNCLTHASGASHRLASNERLEFLGDSVLGLVVCTLLYERFPDQTEGELTKVKSVLVSRITCARIAESLGCERFLFLGKGLSNHNRIPSSVLAAVFESLIAGIYLDGGLEPAHELIERVMDPEIEATVGSISGGNFKSQLQHLAQKTKGTTPIYRLVDEKGPDHSKCFQIAAVIGDHIYHPAWGPNKKEAEQRAAQNALCEIQGKPIPYAIE